MGAVCYGTAIIADQQVRVMILLVCDLRDHIDERHGLVIIFKGVAVADGFIFLV